MYPGYIFLTMLAINEHLTNVPYSLMLFIYGTSASFACILGILFMNAAITYGKAGSVSSIF